VTKLNYFKANWTKIHKELEKETFEHKGCPEFDSEGITRIIMDAALKHVPVKADTKFRTRWWTPELSKLRSE